MLKKVLYMVVFGVFTVSMNAANTLYWASTGTSGRNSNTAVNFSINKDTYSNPDSLLLSSGDTFAISNIANTYYQFAASYLSEIAAVKNESTLTEFITASSTSTTFDFAIAGNSSADAKTVIGNITQNAATDLRVRKSSSGTYANFEIGSIDVKKGSLSLYQSSTAYIFNSVNVTGATTLSDGTTFSTGAIKGTFDSIKSTGATEMRFAYTTSGATYDFTKGFDVTGSTNVYFYTYSSSVYSYITSLNLGSWKSSISNASMLRAYVEQGFSLGDVTLTRNNATVPNTGGSYMRFEMYTKADKTKNNVGDVVVGLSADSAHTDRIEVGQIRFISNYEGLAENDGFSINSIKVAENSGIFGRFNVYSSGSAGGKSHLTVGDVSIDKNFGIVLGEDSDVGWFNSITLADVSISSGNLYTRSASNKMNSLTIADNGTANYFFDRGNVSITKNLKVGESSSLKIEAGDTNKYTVKVDGSLTLGALSTLDVNSNAIMTIAEDLDATSANSAGNHSRSLIARSGEMYIKGVLQKGTGAVSSITLAGTLAEGNTVYELGGIQGGTDSAGTSNRVTTNYSTGDGAKTKAVEIIIKGTEHNGEVFIYTGRLHDMSGNTTDIDKVITGELSITMDAANTTQYFAGQNYIRGITTVKNGTLVLSSNKAKDDGSPWYFGEISVAGGALGVCGTYSNGIVKIGELRGTNLSWAGGNILIDLSETANDKIILSGNFMKYGDMHKFGFDWEDGADLDDKSYEIVVWEGGTDFIAADFEAMLKDTDYKATFRIDGNSLWVDFALIPEPSTYAAIFGALSLLLVFYRRRKK